MFGLTLFFLQNLIYRSIKYTSQITYWIIIVHEKALQNTYIRHFLFIYTIYSNTQIPKMHRNKPTILNRQIQTQCQFQVGPNVETLHNKTTEIRNKPSKLVSGSSGIFSGIKLIFSGHCFLLRPFVSRIGLRHLSPLFCSIKTNIQFPATKKNNE